MLLTAKWLNVLIQFKCLVVHDSYLPFYCVRSFCYILQMFLDEHVSDLEMLVSGTYATGSCLLDAALFEAAGLHIIEAKC